MSARLPKKSRSTSSKVIWLGMEFPTVQLATMAHSSAQETSRHLQTITNSNMSLAPQGIHSQTEIRKCRQDGGAHRYHAQSTGLWVIPLSWFSGLEKHIQRRNEHFPSPTTLWQTNEELVTFIKQTPKTEGFGNYFPTTAR